jgi:hypothetical protein
MSVRDDQRVAASDATRSPFGKYLATTRDRNGVLPRAGLALYLSTQSPAPTLVFSNKYPGVTRLSEVRLAFGIILRGPDMLVGLLLVRLM